MASLEFKKKRKMKKKIFGTDGIRGLASKDPFTEESLNALSNAIIYKSKKKRILIGRDTRESSTLIENLLVKALKKYGANVYLAGLISTPAISYLTRKFICDLGIVVSASHNPYQFNGIKFFNKKGEKLSESNENLIERAFFKFRKEKLNDSQNGKIIKIKNPGLIYKKNVLSSLEKNFSLNNMKIVIDCANGSTYKIAKDIFSKLKAKLLFINTKPNGKNINLRCGSLYPNNLIKYVKKYSADFGISFDGDGDRILCCDEVGTIIDGDKILALLAKSYYSKGLIKGIGVVGTIMSNMGLENFLKKFGIKLYRSAVGDKFVYNLMEKKKCNIGGEQSGHIILKDHSFSGDGILVSLQILSIIKENKEKASRVFDLYKAYPQVLKNIKLKDSIKVSNTELKKITQKYNKKLKKNGRVLIRHSGTEPVIRIFIELKEYSYINNLMKKIHRDINLLIKKK